MNSVLRVLVEPGSNPSPEPFMELGQRDANRMRAELRLLRDSWNRCRLDFGGPLIEWIMH